MAVEGTVKTVGVQAGSGGSVLKVCLILFFNLSFADVCVSFHGYAVTREDSGHAHRGYN